MTSDVVWHAMREGQEKIMLNSFAVQNVHGGEDEDNTTTVRADVTCAR